MSNTKKKHTPINIKNRKAKFEYALEEEFTAGLMLQGTEIKSLREGKASLQESFCLFLGQELYIRNMNIAHYSHGNIHNHEPTRDRKLLLSKREIRKLQEGVEREGYTIVPTRLFISQRGWAKLNIALGKGKKLYDKRQSIKEKEQKRSIRNDY